MACCARSQLTAEARRDCRRVRSSCSTTRYLTRDLCRVTLCLKAVVSLTRKLFDNGRSDVFREKLVSAGISREIGCRVDFQQRESHARLIFQRSTLASSCNPTDVPQPRRLKAVKSSTVKATAARDVRVHEKGFKNLPTKKEVHRNVCAITEPSDESDRKPRLKEIMSAEFT